MVDIESHGNKNATSRLCQSRRGGLSGRLHLMPSFYVCATFAKGGS